MRDPLADHAEGTATGPAPSRPGAVPHRRPPPTDQLVGNSPPMQQLRRDIAAVAQSDATVLVIGPTGAGKDNVARAIHAAGARRHGRFEAVNCGAIPRDLAEAELFGAEAGAYTGATKARIGRFEAANGGTLFLDEVGELPLDLQVKLLRVLEVRQVERLGGGRAVPLDIRVIAATNIDLECAVAAGRFRADLYWRLAVVTMDVPSLAERPSDVPALIAHFARAARAAVRLTDCGADALARHPWPGNVRELRNLVERAAALGEHVLDAPSIARLTRPRRRQVAQWLTNDGTGAPASPSPPTTSATGYNDSAHNDRAHNDRAHNDSVRLPARPAGFAAAGPMSPGALKSLLAETEAALIAQALDQANGTIAEAGRILGMKRTTLTEKMRRMGLKAANEAA